MIYQQYSGINRTGRMPSAVDDTTYSDMTTGLAQQLPAQLPTQLPAQAQAQAHEAQPLRQSSQAQIMQNPQSASQPSAAQPQPQPQQQQQQQQQSAPTLSASASANSVTAGQPQDQRRPQYGYPIAYEPYVTDQQVSQPYQSYQAQLAYPYYRTSSAAGYSPMYYPNQVAPTASGAEYPDSTAAASASASAAAASAAAASAASAYYPAATTGYTAAPYFYAPPAAAAAPAPSTSSAGSTGQAAAAAAAVAAQEAMHRSVLKPKITTTMWEDEKTLCYQVEANGVIVVRRADNDMINGTKLLNVTKMTRGRRDGILKAEKVRHVVKIGSLHLKGIWIPFERAVSMAKRECIYDLLYPLFVKDIASLIQQGTPVDARDGRAGSAPRVSYSAAGAQPQPAQPQPAPQQQQPYYYYPGYVDQGYYSQSVQRARPSIASQGSGQQVQQAQQAQQVQAQAQAQQAQAQQAQAGQQYYPYYSPVTYSGDRAGHVGAISLDSGSRSSSYQQTQSVSQPALSQPALSQSALSQSALSQSALSQSAQAQSAPALPAQPRAHHISSAGAISNQPVGGVGVNPLMSPAATTRTAAPS